MMKFVYAEKVRMVSKEPTEINGFQSDFGSISINNFLGKASIGSFLGRICPVDAMFLLCSQNCFTFAI